MQAAQQENFAPNTIMLAAGSEDDEEELTTNIKRTTDAGPTMADQANQTRCADMEAFDRVAGKPFLKSAASNRSAHPQHAPETVRL